MSTLAKYYIATTGSTAILVALRVAGFIHWPIACITAPLWLPIAAILALFAACMIVYCALWMIGTADEILYGNENN